MLIAEIMAETQRTLNPTIIIAATYCMIFWFLMGQAILFTFWPDDAGASELMALPSITVGEEYNDNVFLTRYNKLDDYITRVIPAFHLTYKTSLWDLKLDLSYDYRYYAKGTKTGDSTYRANLRDHSELINNFFFIDVLDTYDRVSESVARDFTTQSLFVNQTDTNVFTFNPYFVMRNESRYTPILGYKYVNTWYKQSGNIDTVENIGYAEMITALSSSVTFTAGVRYTQGLNKIEDYDRLEIYAGPSYTYAPNSYVFFTIGENWFDFEHESENTKHMVWDAGITHRYSTVTVAYRMKSEYIPDPLNVLKREDSYVATLTKEVPRTSFSVLAGLFEFRGAKTSHLENTTYQLTGTLSHAISPTLTFGLHETIRRLEDNVNDTVIALWESGVRLERRILADLILSLDYRYTNSYSHNSYSDNYVNNRFSIELSKSF